MSKMMKMMQGGGGKRMMQNDEKYAPISTNKFLNLLV
jgi:hypothetical protein